MVAEQPHWTGMDIRASGTDAPLLASPAAPSTTASATASATASSAAAEASPPQALTDGESEHTTTPCLLGRHGVLFLHGA